MNRSRRRVSIMYTLVTSLIMGLTSAFCLAPAYAAPPSIETIYLRTMPPENTVHTSEPATESATVPSGSGTTAPSTGVVVENAQESAAAETPMADPSAPAAEETPVPPPEDGAAELSDPPGMHPAPSDPPVVAPVEPNDEASERSDGDGSLDGVAGDGSGEAASETGSDQETSNNGTGAEDDAAPDDGVTLHPARGTLPQAQVGEQYSAQLSAAGSARTYFYDVLAPELLPLPEGLTLNRTSGVLSGVPESVGRYTFTVEVSTADGSAPARKAFSIEVAGADLGISLSANSGMGLDSARVGEAVRATFATAGGAGPYTYSIGGAQLSEPGTDPGAPAGGPTEPAPFALTGPEPEVPVTVTVRRAEGSSTGPAAAGNLPAPLRLDSAGKLHGIPQQPGRYEFTVVSTDRYGSNTNKDFTLTVLAAGAQAAPAANQSPEAAPAPTNMDQRSLDPDTVGANAGVPELPLAHTGASWELLLVGLTSLLLGAALMIFRSSRLGRLERP